MTLLDRVRRTIRDHDLARRDTRVVVAVSGGSDSIALAHLLRELERGGELRVVTVAHFNHQLRPTAGHDESVASAAAQSLGWRFVAEHEDVAALARREQRSIEDAARTARLAFLERVRLRVSGDVVALGHTRDDQAETFLLRLLRGAGPRGLASMYPKNGPLIRPLLECRRSELRAYLVEKNIPFADDETNADVAIPRNRIRRELLPFLEQRFNPRIVEVLADEAALARDEWTWMCGAADELVQRVVSRVAPRTPIRLGEGCVESSEARGRELRGDAGPERIELDLRPLADSPVALRRLVLWRAMNEAADGRPIAFEHVEAVMRMIAEGTESAGIDVPGHRVQRIGPRLVLTGRPRSAVGRTGSERPVPNGWRYPLAVPGEVALPEIGWVVSAEERPAADGVDWDSSSGAAVAIVRSDMCRGSLAVRTRRPGDRFKPLGLGGQKKLQDFFVDRKVGRGERDTVPLVVDDRDRIVWVAGYTIDDQFRVTDPTQGVLILRLRRL